MSWLNPSKFIKVRVIQEVGNSKFVVKKVLFKQRGKNSPYLTKEKEKLIDLFSNLKENQYVEVRYYEVVQGYRPTPLWRKVTYDELKDMLGLEF